MLLPISPRRSSGQCKPYGSIPRIDWSHPLTRGLVSYGYDAGCGPIDLVMGGQRTIVNSARLTGIAASQYGSGLLYLGSTVVSQACAATLPLTTWANHTAAAPYSFACGVMITTTLAASCIIYSTFGGGATPIQIGTGNVTSTDFFWQFGNGSNNATAVGFAAPNVFHTVLGVALTGSTTACYVDGTLNISPAVTTTFSSAAQPGFSGIFNTALSQAFFTGFIYYGALWKNRALTAPEARLLHDDPYCFLIYPEDEIFSEMVNSDLLMAQIWM